MIPEHIYASWDPDVDSGMMQIEDTDLKPCED